MLNKLRIEAQEGLLVSKTLRAWKRTLEDPTLGVPSPRVLDRDSQVFVIGSCFANEIRAVLETQDVCVHPRMDPRVSELLPADLKIDPAWGPWDERVHYQCYTPFSILQEIRIALGTWAPSPKALMTTKKDGETAYWDPYRRSVYTETAEDTLAVRAIMNQRIQEGIEAADVLIFTLGLIESFAVAGFDGVAAEFNMAFRKKLSFQDIGYAETVAAVDEACRLVLERYPKKQIVLTISRIPLNMTFTRSDVVTATMRGKSTLRAAADTVVRAHKNVSYFPSYEYVMWRGDAFREEDLRHVKPAVVAEITQAFCEAWFREGVLKPGDAYYPEHVPAPAPVRPPEKPRKRGVFRRLLGRRASG